MSATVVPAIIAIKARRYKEAFRNAGATTPLSAQRLADLGLRENLILHKLVRNGVLVAIPGGRYYLDEVRDAETTRVRQKLVLGLLVVVVILIILSTITATKA